MSFLFTLAAIVLLFSLTIFVHELGHFLAARACGMVIEVFSIGFGPAIWKRRVNGVLYKIGILPLGGYVALPQLDPTGEAESEAALDPARPPVPPASPGQKIFVAAAGAAGNLLFAVLLAWIVYGIGKPSAPHERRCVLGFVSESSEAWTLGLRIGDEILRADDQSVGNWQDLLTHLALTTGDSVNLLVRDLNGGPERTLRIQTRETGFGLRLPEGLEMENLCRVGEVVSGGSAEAAGLQSGDLILEVAGEKIYSREHLIAIVDQHRNRDTVLRIKRGKDLLDLTVRPAYDEKLGRALIGILFSQINVDFDTITHPKPFVQIREHASAIFRFLRALMTPREAKAAAGAVGGPISILYTYWQMMESSFRMALWFTVFLNVNLGILNLLPIPVLDGGHIVFAAFEAIFRRPVPKFIVLWSYRIFATLLIGVFLLLTVRDSRRWILPFFRTEKSALPAAVEPKVPDPVPQAETRRPDSGSGRSGDGTESPIPLR